MNRRGLLALLIAVCGTLFESEARADSEDSGETEGDHDDALRAVETEGAVSLRAVLQAFHSAQEGTVVDVTLLRGDRLRYRIKYVDGQGRVVFVDYDALSGQPVP